MWNSNLSPGLAASTSARASQCSRNRAAALSYPINEPPASFQRKVSAAVLEIETLYGLQRLDFS